MRSRLILGTYCAAALCSTMTPCSARQAFDPAGPFGHYLNPSLPGASNGPGQGDNVQNYGETEVDGMPLDDFPAINVNLFSSSDWHGPSPAETASGVAEDYWFVGDYAYRRRSVDLPSGGKAVILAGFEKPEPLPPQPLNPGPADLFTGVSGNDCPNFDQDVVVMIRGTTYETHEEGVLAALGVETPETPATSLPVNSGPLDGSSLMWVWDNSPAFEAMTYGATIVHLQPSIGGRPFLWTLAQMLELVAWMNTTDYRVDGNNEGLEHRVFVHGGSFGSGVAIISAIHMPWLVRGAIGLLISGDFRQMTGWQRAEGYTRHFRKVGGFGYTNLDNPQMNSLWGDLEHGFDGDGILDGLFGSPFDTASMSLISTDLGLTQDAANLQVPLAIVTGDEDPGSYTFFASSFASNNPGGNLIEKRVPLMEHAFFELPDFNASEMMTPEGGIYRQVLSKAGCDPVDPQSHAPSWDDDTAATDEHVVSDFDHYFLTGDRPVRVDPQIDVVDAPETGWSDFRGFIGLAANTNNFLQIEASQGEPFGILTCTARGEVVRINLEEDANGAVEFAVAWRKRLPEPAINGRSRLGGVELCEGPQEGTYLALHEFGSLFEVGADGTTTLLIENKPISPGSDLSLGSRLRSLRRLGNDYVAINNQGDLIRFQLGPQPSATKYPVEGGFTRLENVPGSTDELVYGSYHGNLKKVFASQGFEHPSVPNPTPGTLSHFLGGEPDTLELFDLVPGVPLYQVVVKKHGISILNDDLVLLQEFTQPPQGPDRLALPDRIQYVGPGVGTNLLFLAAWDNLPEVPTPGMTGQKTALFGDTPAIGVLNLDYADPTIDMSRLLAYELLDAPVSALKRISPTAALEAGAPKFSIEWLGLTYSGQVLAIGAVDGGSSFEMEVLGSGFTSVFGLARKNEAPDQVFALSANRGVTCVDVQTGSSLDCTTETNAMFERFDSTLSTIYGPSWEGSYSPVPRWSADFVMVDSEPALCGFYDGGQTYRYVDGNQETQLTSWIAAPWSSFSNLDFDTVWGGCAVLDFELLDGPEFLFMSVLPTDGLHTEKIVSPVGVGYPISNVHHEGNSAHWADLDGDGQLDLVVGTHGGRLFWYRNTNCDSGGVDCEKAPDFVTVGPTQTMLATGQFITAGQSSPGLGADWVPDLGAGLVGIESFPLPAGLQLGSNPSAEGLVVGTELTANVGLLESFAPYMGDAGLGTGHLIVARKGANDDLEELARIELGPGVWGVRYTDLLSNPAFDSGDDFLVGTLDGRLHIVNLSVNGGNAVLTRRYSTKQTSPWLGAYNSIEVFETSPSTVRVVAGSSDGLWAFDICPSGCP